MILSLLVLLSTLEGTPESVTGPYSQEELAGGAIREIISAQAYHRKAFPALGFACSIDRLVAVQALGDVWLTGKRVDGYRLELWCQEVTTPQSTYRASAIPTKKTKGAMLTVCADEENVPHTSAVDLQSCFDQRTAPQR